MLYIFKRENIIHICLDTFKTRVRNNIEFKEFAYRFINKNDG